MIKKRQWHWKPIEMRQCEMKRGLHFGHVLSISSITLKKLRNNWNGKVMDWQESYGLLFNKSLGKLINVNRTGDALQRNGILLRGDLNAVMLGYHITGPPIGSDGWGDGNRVRFVHKHTTCMCKKKCCGLVAFMAFVGFASGLRFNFFHQHNGFPWQGTHQSGFSTHWLCVQKKNGRERTAWCLSSIGPGFHRNCGLCLCSVQLLGQQGMQPHCLKPLAFLHGHVPPRKCFCLEPRTSSVSRQPVPTCSNPPPQAWLKTCPFQPKKTKLVWSRFEVGFQQEMQGMLTPSQTPPLWSCVWTFCDFIVRPLRSWTMGVGPAMVSFASISKKSSNFAPKSWSQKDRQILVASKGTDYIWTKCQVHVYNCSVCYSCLVWNAREWPLCRWSGMTPRRG